MIQKLHKKKVTIIGMSLSGTAAARLAAQQGAAVYVSEYADSPQLRDTGRRLRRHGIAVELGGHTPVFLRGTDLMITSPGVKPQAMPLVWARERGIALVSELEFAGWQCRIPIIAVTGSNGKTTVTTLIGKLLHDAGYRALVCGNIGLPLSSVVERGITADMIVLEVSSFQMEYTPTFRPRVSVVLNLTQNHLDHHPSLADYRAAKARLVAQQRGGDCAVLNFDDRWVKSLQRRTRARSYFFTTHEKSLPAAARAGIGACGIRDGWIVYQDRAGVRPLVELTAIRIPGVHNQANVMAGLLAVRRWRIPRASLQRTIARFKGVEHRCELVGRRDGIAYVNDAKSTTVDATVKALSLYPDRSVVLICGGRNKGSDFRPLRPLAGRKVRAVVAIGEAGEQLCDVFKTVTAVYRETSLAGAVRRARRLAQSGMTVLLSPMCASFDMFRNYEHRGRVFKDLVRQELQLP